MSSPLVTAIVSTYCAERFMRGCLEGLINQTLLKEMEILVIDSGSPQAEGEICREFMHHYPQIKLIRTEREPLYVAWNRALQLAKGQYVTNANTDDRHSPQFMEILVGALDRHSDVGLVYANQFVSHGENETFEQCQARTARIRHWPDYTPEDLILRCITGSQPMWRKSLHQELGYFNTSYNIAADYDMWLRFASRLKLLHLPETLGVLFDSPETISGTNNRLRLNLEVLSIQKACMELNQWRNLPGIRKRLAAELFGRGYQHIEHDRDGKAAEPLIREAIKLDPTNLSFLKTYIIRCMAGIA